MFGSLISKEIIIFDSQTYQQCIFIINKYIFYKYICKKMQKIQSCKEYVIVDKMQNIIKHTNTDNISICIISPCILSYQMKAFYID